MLKTHCASLCVHLPAAAPTSRDSPADAAVPPSASVARHRTSTVREQCQTNAWTRAPETLQQTDLLRAAGLLRGYGELFFQLADLLKQLPVLGFLLVQLALNTKSLFLKLRPKFKRITHNFRNVHFRRTTSESIHFSNQFKLSKLYENNMHKFWTVR